MTSGCADPYCTHPLTLRFPAQAERAFQADQHPKIAHRTRVFAIVLAVLLALFEGVPVLLRPISHGGMRLPYQVHYAFAVAVVNLIVSRTRWCVAWRHAAYGVPVCAYAAVQVSLGAFARSVGVGGYGLLLQLLVVTTLLTLVTLTLSQLGFVFANLAALGVMAGWVAAYLIAGGMNLVGAAFHATDLLMGYLFGGAVRCALESGTRREFVQRRLLDAERARSERLLLNILPAPITERLKEREGTIADSYPEATVLFADVVDFTSLSSQMTAEALVGTLDGLFSQFDALTEKHRLEKIKTIGDAYMVVAGVPTPKADHAQVVVSSAMAKSPHGANESPH